MSCNSLVTLGLQSDQGTEFKGVVEKIMDIYSRPYHPRSQGKVNRFIINPRRACAMRVTVVHKGPVIYTHLTTGGSIPYTKRLVSNVVEHQFLL